MRTMLIAAAALNLGVGAAYARDDEGRVAIAANSQSPTLRARLSGVRAERPPVVAQGRRPILL